MWQWLVTNWGLLLAGLLFADYFAVYVLARRDLHTSGVGPKRPCDLC